MNRWILYGITALLVLEVALPLYVKGKNKRPSGLWTLLKGGGTLLIAALAWYGFCNNPDIVSLYLAAGLTAGAVADVILNLHFFLGVCCFAVGHLFYLEAFLRMGPVQLFSILPFLILVAIAVTLLSESGWKIKLEEIPYLLYGLLLLLLVSIALLLPATAGWRGAAASTGMMLFAISDLMIARGKRVAPVQGQNFWVMFTYYLAQLLLCLVALQPWL